MSTPSTCGEDERGAQRRPHFDVGNTVCLLHGCRVVEYLIVRRLIDPSGTWAYKLRRAGTKKVRSCIVERALVKGILEARQA